MKANVTIENIWFNSGLRNFFFRDQAFKTLEDLVNRSELSERETIEFLDAHYEDYDLDELEEMFYNDSVEEITSDCGLTLEEEEEENED